MKKSIVLSKIVLLAVIAAMFSAALPGMYAFAEEADGILWDSMDTDEHWWMADNDAKTIELSVNADPEFIREGTGSLAVKRTAAGPGMIRGNQIFPESEGRVIRSLSVWVYSDGADGTVGILGTVGASNVNTDNSDAKKTIVPGWQQWFFDVTQFDKLDLFIWRSDTPGGTLYFDDMRITYSQRTEPLDSFENYTQNWKAHTAEYAVSENTDAQFVKDGDVSLKVVCGSQKGESHLLLSKNWNLGEGDKGMRIPEFSGYAKNTIGFWVYNQDAEGVFVLGERKLPMREQGWHYFKYDARNLNSMFSIIFQCTKPGTFYLDALTVEYDDLSATVLDRLEATSAWNGTKPEYLQIVDGGMFAKEGLTSAKITLPAGLKETGIHRSDWKTNGLPVPQKAEQVISQVGMWVYGCGDPGVTLKLGLRDITGKDASTAAVSIDWEGWKFVTFDVGRRTGFVYQFIVKNTSDAEKVFYIDNVEAIYVPNNGIIDSMDTVAEDWFFSAGAKLAAEQNTEPAYIKDGTGSAKITRNGAGEFGFVSANYKNNGLNFPDNPGKTPDILGFWIYNVDAADTVAVDLKLENGELVRKQLSMPEPGQWAYVETEVDGASALYQFVFGSTAESGTFYLDGITLQYLDNERYVFDAMELKNGETPLEVGQLKDQDTITLEARISKTDNTQRSLSLILAVYAADGRLIGVEAAGHTIATEDNGEFVKTVEYTVQDASSVGYVKGFAMDSLQTLAPLCGGVQR